MTTALLFIEGFDKYGPTGAVGTISAAALAGDWASMAVVPSLTAPLSSNGGAINISNLNSMVSSTFTAVSRIAGSLRMMSTAATAVSNITLRNGSNSAFTISIDPTNGVRIRTGGTSGTILATGGSITTNVAVVVSFDVTIGASSSYSVRIDGSVVLSGTGDTGNGQSSVNTLVLACTTASTAKYDDIALYDPANANYNSAVLTSQVVVETQFPTADYQTQFTNNGNYIVANGLDTYGLYRKAGTPITGADQLLLIKVVPQSNCTLNTISFGAGSASAGAKVKSVVYSDSAGSPDALLDTGVELVGVVSGTNTLTLTTPQSLTSGTSYWIGFITDTNFSLLNYETTHNLGIKKANTYGSGAPNPAGGGFTTGLATYMFWGNVTGSAVNWVSVGLNPASDSSLSQVSSITVTDEDLFTFPALVSTPSAIYGGAVKIFAAKADSGARTGNINVLSGATDSTGSNAGFSFLTSFQWIGSIYDLDPNTASAWTQSGVNNAKSGYSVAS